MSDFEKKVRQMKSSEIIKAMVEGLENPVTVVDMGTYGTVRNGICYGCAATNAVCKIGGFVLKDLKADADNLFHYGTMTCRTNSFLFEFERAIDALRRGYLYDVNEIFEEIGLRPIMMDDYINLPTLRNESYKDNLEPYKKLAAYNKSIGN